MFYYICTAQFSSLIFQHHTTGGSLQSPISGGGARAVIVENLLYVRVDAVQAGSYVAAPIIERLSKSALEQDRNDIASPVYDCTGNFKIYLKIGARRIALVKDNELLVDDHCSSHLPLRDLLSMVQDSFKEQNVWCNVIYQYLWHIHNIWYRCTWVNTWFRYSSKLCIGGKYADRCAYNYNTLVPVNMFYFLVHIYLRCMKITMSLNAIYVVLGFHPSNYVSSCNSNVINFVDYYSHIFFIVGFCYIYLPVWNFSVDIVYAPVCLRIKGLYLYEYSVFEICIWSGKSLVMFHLIHDIIYVPSLSSPDAFFRVLVRLPIVPFSFRWCALRDSPLLPLCTPARMVYINALGFSGLLYPWTRIRIKHSIFKRYIIHTYNIVYGISHSIIKVYVNYSHTSDKEYVFHCLYCTLPMLYVLLHVFNYKSTWE